MRQKESNIIEEKNKETLEYYNLYEIKIDDDNILRFVSNNEIVTFNGNTYNPFPISHSEISENSSTEIETLQISVSNVSRFIQQFCKDNEMRGKEIKIITVFKDKLDVPTARIEDKYYIDSYEITEKNATFKISTKFDVLGVQLPKRVFTKTNCNWIFKDGSCKYSGNETSCDKTFETCVLLNNVANFGGFPAIPPKKVYAV